MEDVTVFKLVSIVAIWLVGLAGGLAPALLAGSSNGQRNSPRTAHLLSVLNAFSGGVFLAGGFFHLLHAAIENPALRKWSEVDDGRYEFPYAEMFCTLGFIGLLLLEQGAHAHIGTTNGSMTHSDAAKSGSYTRAKTTDHDDLDEEFGAVRADDASDTYVEDLDDDSGSNGSTHHSHSHVVGHSHMGAAPTNGSSLAVAVVLFIALSFHSVLEGLGIGAQPTSAWGVFAAIVVHKGLAAFALGSGLVQSALPRGHVALYMVLFSCMSIIGIIVGWVIAVDAADDSAAAGICVALASGTFIYVAVMEVIPQEFPRHGGSGTSVKAAALCLGYAVFGLLAKWS